MFIFCLELFGVKRVYGFCFKEFHSFCKRPSLSAKNSLSLYCVCKERISVRIERSEIRIAKAKSRQERSSVGDTAWAWRKSKTRKRTKRKKQTLLKEIVESLYENFRSQEPANFLQILTISKMTGYGWHCERFNYSSSNSWIPEPSVREWRLRAHCESWMTDRKSKTANNFLWIKLRNITSNCHSRA